jgi:hypothetical protein
VDPAAGAPAWRYRYDTLKTITTSPPATFPATLRLDLRRISAPADFMLISLRGRLLFLRIDALD